MSQGIAATSAAGGVVLYQMLQRGRGLKEKGIMAWK